MLWRLKDRLQTSYMQIGPNFPNKQYFNGRMNDYDYYILNRPWGNKKNRKKQSYWMVFKTGKSLGHTGP